MAALDKALGGSALELPDIPGRIEHSLAYLRNEWESVPELAAEWHEWDEESRFSFAIDWPLREDWLHQLEQWQRRGLLTPDQQARYESLLALIAAHRPTLERLLND